MNLPNTLTVIRIILAPIYFVAFFFAEWTDTGHVIPLVVLALVFIVMEISDLLDGYFARKYQLVADIGKVIDPFGDVMSRLTYFFCFTLTGLMPAWIFLVLLYRELGITFMRMLMIRRGIAMAASVWGKAKAVTYAAGGILGLAYVIFFRLAPQLEFLPILKTVTVAVFIFSAFSSVLSFVTYVRLAMKEEK